MERDKTFVHPASLEKQVEITFSYAVDDGDEYLFSLSRPRSRTDGDIDELINRTLPPCCPRQGPSSPSKSPPSMNLPPSSFWHGRHHGKLMFRASGRSEEAALPPQVLPDSASTPIDCTARFYTPGGICPARSPFLSTTRRNTIGECSGSGSSAFSLQSSSCESGDPGGSFQSKKVLVQAQVPERPASVVEVGGELLNPGDARTKERRPLEFKQSRAGRQTHCAQAVAVPHTAASTVSIERLRNVRHQNPSSNSLSSANTCGVSYVSSPVASSEWASSDSDADSTDSSNVIVKDAATNLARHFNKHVCFADPVAHPRRTSAGALGAAEGVAKTCIWPVPDEPDVCLRELSDDSNLPNANDLSPFASPSPSPRAEGDCSDATKTKFCASPLLSFTLEQIRRKSCGEDFFDPVDMEPLNDCGGVPELCLAMSHMMEDETL